MDIKLIKDRVKSIIIESMSLAMTPEEIDGSDLINELVINSIDAISIFVFIENEFDIEINEEDLSVELIASIDRITTFILKKITDDFK